MTTPVFQLSESEAACTCAGQLHPEAIHGLHLFNDKRFYDAHEAFENAWRAEKDPIRELYRGILQVGAAYYQIQRGKYEGGIAFFTSCRKWLDPFPDVCRGIQVAQLRRDFQVVEKALIQLGPEKINLFNPDIFKPVLFTL